MNTTSIAGNRCPKCDANLEGNTGNGAPSPGDISICLYCQNVFVFDTQLKLRRPTEEEIESFKADVELWRQISCYCLVAVNVYREIAVKSN